MKWNQRSKRELELIFESGTTVLMIDRKPAAAKIPQSETVTQVITTKRQLDAESKRLLDMWLGNQPTRMTMVTDDIIENIIESESKK